MSVLRTVLGEEQRRDLRESAVPGSVEPMLATLVDQPFSDPHWIYERKLDGERCLALRDGGRVRLLSRGNQVLNDTYPELVAPLERTATDRFLIDGEIVAFEGDVTSFSRLQRRMQISDPDEARASDVRVRYYVFDVLHADGYDTTRLALRDRKRLLRRLGYFDDPLRYTPHRNEDGVAFHREACEKGWEGLIAKDATAPYSRSRSRRWLKFKCVEQQELVIGGFTDPEGERSRFGALLVGYHHDGDLVYAGKVGTGFDERTLDDLGSRMEALERRTPPFDRGALPARNVHWVEPDLVAEIGFTEWTRDGKPRHPRYLGLRRDTDASDVVREVPA